MLEQWKSRMRRSNTRYDVSMRSRISLFAILFLAGSLALPMVAQAGGIPFFGPIIPQDGGQAVCPASWGMLITVINNIISFLITIAIVFVAPLMIAWAGFLYVVNPVSPDGIKKARSILTNTIVGIVIALAGWMIVDAIMAMLYNANASNERGGVLGTWSSLIGSGGLPPCIDLKGSVAPTVAPPIVVPVVPGRFTFDRGIDAQVPTESAALANLLSCMVTKVPAGVGRISSISDSLITKGQKSFSQCASGGCQHSANSCHYGGKTCVGSSYAVDFGDEQNARALTSAAQACGANYIGNEGNHLHVSVGSSCGCN